MVVEKSVLMSSSIADVYVSDLKLVLLGESSVGKSSIVMRYVTSSFQKTNATIGAAFTTRTFEVPQCDGSIKRINLEIWDTAGQERYRSLAPMYFRNTDIALVVFDVTKPESLRKAQSWIEELNSYVEEDRRDDLRIKVIGNKKDLEHDPVGTIEGLPLFTVSAKTGEGIDELFESLVNDIPPGKFKKLDVSKHNAALELDKGPKARSGCC